MEEMEERSKDNSLLLVNVCLDYSGKWDIAQSCMKTIHKHHIDSLVEDELSKDIDVDSLIQGILVGLC